MCTWLLSRNNPLVRFGGGLALVLLLAATPARAQKAEAPPPQGTSTPDNIVLVGKLSCSLKRQVALPFLGVIAELLVRPGQKVQAGEPLARYRLSPEAVLELERRVSPPQIKDLEIKLAEAQKNLQDLERKQRTLKQLAREKMAPNETLTQVERDLVLAARQRTAVADRLTQERRLAKEDLAVLKKQLGGAIAPGQVPREAALVTPISGYVIWVHPELRPGAELGPTAPVFQVGMMDPMLIKARVHEIEAQQLSLGDQAEVTLESIPGRKFTAKLSRLSWAPLEPAPDQPTYYDVEFSLPNPDLVLKEGLKARLVLPKSK